MTTISELKNSDEIKMIKSFIKRNAYPPVAPHYQSNLVFVGGKYNSYTHIWGFDYDQISLLPFDPPISDVPGFSILNFENIKDKDELLERVRSDMDFLGVDIQDDVRDEKVENGEWRIAIYLGDKNDFHFMRENADGTWSHKIGYHHIIETKEYPPQKLDTGVEQIYDLIGVYRLKVREEENKAEIVKVPDEDIIKK